MAKGIENIKQFGSAILEASDMVGDILADGKINLADITQAPRLIGIAGQVGGSFVALPGEALDLTDEEETELREYFKTKVEELSADIQPDVIEKIAGMVLDSAIKVAGIVSSIIAVRKQSKS